MKPDGSQSVPDPSPPAETSHKPEEETTTPAVASLVTTTVRLPRQLYDEARQVVEKGKTEATSLNDLLVRSLGEKLRQLRREHVNAEFVGMSTDAQYQRESEVLAEEFASNDRTTFRSAEKEKS